MINYPNTNEEGFLSLLTPAVEEKLKQKKQVTSSTKSKGLLENKKGKVQSQLDKGWLHMLQHPFGEEPSIKPDSEADALELGNKLKRGASAVSDAVSSVAGDKAETPTYDAYGTKDGKVGLNDDLMMRYTGKTDEEIAEKKGYLAEASDTMGWDADKIDQATQEIITDRDAVGDFTNAATEPSMWEEALGYLGYGADMAKELWEYTTPVTDAGKWAYGKVSDGVGFVNDRVDILTMLAAGAKAGYDTNNAGIGALVGLSSGFSQASANKAGEVNATEEQRRRAFDENIKERETVVKEKGLLGKPKSGTELSTSERAITNAYSEDSSLDPSVANQAALLLKQNNQAVTPDALRQTVEMMKSKGLLDTPLMFGKTSLN